MSCSVKRDRIKIRSASAAWSLRSYGLLMVETLHSVAGRPEPKTTYLWPISLSPVANIVGISTTFERRTWAQFGIIRGKMVSIYSDI